MSNPNLYTIFSPKGERFEVTKLNQNDLLQHNGWSLSPNGAKAEGRDPVETPKTDADINHPAPTKPLPPIVAPDPTGHREDVTPDPVVPNPPIVAPDPTGHREPDTAAEITARYAALDKAEVIALLMKEFNFDADGRMSLPKLVAKAVELELAATK
jgi:hypothetical protein